MRIGAHVLVALFALSIVGCSGSDDKIEPAELVEFDAKVKVKKAWAAKLGKDDGELRLGLKPSSNGSRLFAASSNGSVSAFDSITGKLQWRTDTDLRLSAGPGLGRDFVAVGSSEGQVALLSIADGAVLWTVYVAGEVLAAPAVSNDVIVVRTGDGRLLGLDSSDGSEKWVVSHRVQGLTLRGNSSPIIDGDIVISGFDNGRVMAVRVSNGEQLWETTLSEQRGRTEFERLGDVDGSVSIVGEDVFVTGYQGSTALLSLTTGQPVWRQEISSHNQLGLDWERLYITETGDSIVALKRTSGATEWRQANLSNRQVSAPAATGVVVAVGDFEGYVHWLDAKDGRFVARTRAGNGAVVAPPLVVGEMIVVQTSRGELAAFKVDGS